MKVKIGVRGGGVGSGASARGRVVETTFTRADPVTPVVSAQVTTPDEASGESSKTRLEKILSRAKKLKLNLENKQTRFALSGAALVVLSLFTLGDSQLPAAPGEVAPQGRGVDAGSIMGEEGMKRYGLSRRNPEIPWYEKLFCVGLQKSAGCTKEPFHPYLTWWKNFGDSENVDPKTRGRAVKTILKTFKKPPEKNKFKQRRDFVTSAKANNP